jgi:hypothetical protein
MASEIPVAQDPDKYAAPERVIEAAYSAAELVVREEFAVDQTNALGATLAADVLALANMKEGD